MDQIIKLVSSLKSIWSFGLRLKFPLYFVGRGKELIEEEKGGNILSKEMTL